MEVPKSVSDEDTITLSDVETEELSIDDTVNLSEVEAEGLEAIQAHYVAIPDVLDLPISVPWDFTPWDEALDDVVSIEDLMLDDLDARFDDLGTGFDSDIQGVHSFVSDDFMDQDTNGRFYHH